MANFTKPMETPSFFPKLTTFQAKVLSRQELPEVLPKDLLGANQVELDSSKQNLSVAKAQEIICRYFLDKVKQCSPESVLQRFELLFIKPTTNINSTPRQALEQIALLGQEKIFISTFKRSIYILVNNWSVTRQPQYIQELVQRLCESSLPRKNDSVTLRRLHLWRRQFVTSQDYQELKVFVSRFDNREKPHWSKRYSSFFLASQALDTRKVAEQREAARTRYLQLKEQFNFELAMYTARTPSATAQPSTSPNPTALGSEVLRFIEKILLRRTRFSYASCVRIFFGQTQKVCYRDFKQSLINYLLFALDNPSLAEIIKTQLTAKLEALYEAYDKQLWDRRLLLRTCNRIIEYFTTIDQENPSPLFISLAIQGKTSTLASLLLKIVLLCPPSVTHLECCLAQLVRHYESLSEVDCLWLIRFLEVLQVTLAIYADNVQYNLVSVSHNKQEIPALQESNTYRIFSQIRRDTRKVENVA
jgi:hypothetical protein